ncbi:LamG domain-containing protein [Ideonella sp.]|uniref:LamG domain-containing protein n=1 Tax=Ideonella sp. TaxID=1929293 RepID=UPI002B46BBAF|nr:LamG domain-containing protein [Ideonella sp.]HJV71111.1 LamG domain-containing protein [Ideonella sp.]
MTHARFNLGALVLAAACILGVTATHAATVAYYKFENGTDGAPARGKGTILDSSGNGLNGTPFGRPKYKAVSNPDSTLALRFNGTTAGVFVPDNPLLQLTHSLTLEAYVYLRNETGYGGAIIIRSDDRYDWDPYYLIVGGGHLIFLIEEAAGRGSSVVSPSELPKNQWLHIAGTLDDATGVQALYVNGSLVASTVTTIRPFAELKHHGGLGIGAGVQGGVDAPFYFFHGFIDDVRISDVALDPSDFLPPP